MTSYSGSGFEAGDACGEDRWLGIDRLGKFLLRALKAESGEGKSQGFVGLLKDRSSCGEIMIKVEPHAYPLRTLSREDIGQPSLLLSHV